MADKNTLNGALEELGKLMATNLTTKGVASTYDMGLTTLANRILLINGGGELTISLTSDKDILSYADSDSATLTATVLEDSSAVSGETVDFYRYVDGTNDVLLGSDVTDSNGEASYTYASTGVGDIQVYAKVRTLVSKRYEIEDCTEYDTLTTDKQKFTVTSGSATLSYSNDGLLMTGTVASDTVISNNLVLPSEYTAELDVDLSASGWSGSIVFEDMFIALGDDANKLYFFKLSTNTQISIISNFTTNTGTLKLERTGTTIEVYLNGSLIQTLTNISTTNSYGFRTYNGRTLRVKNLKIKPL